MDSKTITHSNYISECYIQTEELILNFIYHYNKSFVERWEKVWNTRKNCWSSEYKWSFDIFQIHSNIWDFESSWIDNFANMFLFRTCIFRSLFFCHRFSTVAAFGIEFKFISNLFILFFRACPHQSGLRKTWRMIWHRKDLSGFSLNTIYIVFSRQFDIRRIISISGLCSFPFINFF